MLLHIFVSENTLQYGQEVLLLLLLNNNNNNKSIAMANAHFETEPRMWKCYWPMRKLNFNKIFNKNFLD